MTTLTADALALRDLKERRDTAKAEYESLNEEYKLAEADLLERMDEEGSEGTKAGGVNFVPAETPYAQVQDRAEFVKWAQENDDELIEPRERKELINALVRRHLDDGEPLPPGLGFYVRRYVSQRAA